MQYESTCKQWIWYYDPLPEPELADELWEIEATKYDEFDEDVEDSDVDEFGVVRWRVMQSEHEPEIWFVRPRQPRE